MLKRYSSPRTWRLVIHTTTHMKRNRTTIFITKGIWFTHSNKNKLFDDQDIFKYPCRLNGTMNQLIKPLMTTMSTFTLWNMNIKIPKSVMLTSTGMWCYADEQRSQILTINLPRIAFNCNGRIRTQLPFGKMGNISNLCQFGWYECNYF